MLFRSFPSHDTVLSEQRKLTETQQRDLVAQKQRQEEEQRKLAEDKKERERELARAAQSNTYYNPRYIPELASKERPIAINIVTYRKIMLGGQ